MEWKCEASVWMNTCNFFVQIVLAVALFSGHCLINKIKSRLPPLAWIMKKWPYVHMYLHAWMRLGLSTITFYEAIYTFEEHFPFFPGAMLWPVIFSIGPSVRLNPNPSPHLAKPMSWLLSEGEWRCRSSKSLPTCLLHFDFLEVLERVHHPFFELDKRGPPWAARIASPLQQQLLPVELLVSRRALQAAPSRRGCSCKNIPSRDG